MSHTFNADELKKQFQKWTDQIGNYNEGCVCELCVSNIYKSLGEEVKKYIVHQNNTLARITVFFSRPEISGYIDMRKHYPGDWNT